MLGDDLVAKASQGTESVIRRVDFQLGAREAGNGHLDFWGRIGVGMHFAKLKLASEK